MGAEDDPHKDVVVVIDDEDVASKMMTMGAKDDDHHPDHMVIDRAVSTFLGFSVWSVTYIILYSVGSVILYWDVNKVGAILPVIPAILVSCLVILLVHTFAVKLVKSCLIKPNPLAVLSDMLHNDTIEKNVALRYVFTIFCIPIHLSLLMGAQHAIHWNDPNHNRREKWLAALGLILILVSYLHRKFIMIYMDDIITNHFNKIKQLRLQQAAAAAAAAAIRSSSTPTPTGTINQQQLPRTIMPPKPSYYYMNECHIERKGKHPARSSK